MTSPIGEAIATEYVSRDVFDHAIANINMKLDALAARLETVVQQTSDGIEAAKRENRDGLATERSQREQDIRAMKVTIDVANERNEKQLGEIDGKLSNLQSELGGAIRELNGTIKGWSGAMEQRDKTAQVRHEQIDKLLETHDSIIRKNDDELERLMGQHASLTNDVKRLRSTIHGDPENKDDAPSLFGMLHDLKEQVGAGFMQTNVQLATAMQQTEANRHDIATINRERAEEKARWSQRKQAAIEFGKLALKSTWGRVAIGTIIAGVIVTIFPELREELLRWLSNQIQTLLVQSGGN